MWTRSVAGAGKWGMERTEFNCNWTVVTQWDGTRKSFPRSNHWTRLLHLSKLPAAIRVMKSSAEQGLSFFLSYSTATDFEVHPDLHSTNRYSPAHTRQGRSRLHRYTRCFL